MGFKYYTDGVIQMRGDDGDPRTRSASGLVDLVKYLAGERKELVVLEVGSYSGESAAIMLGTGLVSRIYCVDPWEPSPELGATDIAKVEAEFDRKHGNDPRVVKVKGTIDTFVAGLSAGRFDMVDIAYIDGCHAYECVTHDIQQVLGSVRPLVGVGLHDFDALGVRRAVIGLIGRPDKVFSDTSCAFRHDRLIAAMDNEGGKASDPLYVITPTGDRREAFSHCVDYMNRQTRKPDMWVIVDDGRTDAVSSQLARIEVPYKLLRYEPLAKNSLVRNLREGSSVVPVNARLCIMEDDDWYPADYLATMYALLERDAFVWGGFSQHFYSIATRQYAELKTTDPTSLHTHGYARRGLATFKRVVGSLPDGIIFVDGKICSAWDGRIAYNTSARPVHLVGYPGGRPGATRNHTLKADAHGWQQDKDGSILRRLIAGDAARYLTRKACVYVFSNVAYPESRKLHVEDDDILVFLNKANNIDYYRGHKNLFVYHRAPEEEYGVHVDGAENWYVFGKNKNTIARSQVDSIKAEYDWDYPVSGDTVRCATTGYMVVRHLQAIYPDHEIVLVNFGYAVAKSTYRYPAHNWIFEDRALRDLKHVYTAATLAEKSPFIARAERDKTAFEVSVSDIFTTEGSDKMTRHDYGPVYADILGSLIGRHVKVMEIGVLGGASIRAVHRVLPQAELYGIDRRSVKGLDFARIVKGDGYSALTWDAVPRDFDLIVDDGSHKPADMLRGIPVFTDHLKAGGVLIIEDIPSDSAADAVSEKLPGARVVKTTPTSEFNDDRVLIWVKPK